MKIISTNSHSFPSARILRDKIFELTGIKFILVKSGNLIKKPDIRFGDSFNKFDDDTKYNSPEFISLCANKYKFSKLLLENDLYTPEFRKDKPDIFPLLIRTNLFLSGGRGIIICKNEDEFSSEWNPSYWWTPFIRTNFEIRAHVLGREVKRIFRKSLENENEYPIRNNAICHFSLTNIEKYPKLNETINSLNNILGVENFYALDIGWDSNNKKYFIFEANTAPGLNDNTAQVYAEFLCRQLNL